MTNEEALNNISNIVVSIAAIVTVVLAWRGLKTWQVELRGKAGYEVAYSCFVAALKLRQEIQIIRNPVQFTRDDEATFLKERGINPEERLSQIPVMRRRAESASYQFRWQPIAHAMQELEAAALDAEAVLGEEAVQDLAALRRITIDLWAAITRHLNSITETDPERGREMALDSDVVIYLDGSDAFSNKLTDTIRQIRARLRPHLG